ncbi:hypothetical protein M427DRAFT_66420 [Gonapodya prolifera JEL478]|uniref:IQ motif and ubiquitin-like domain-containing protein n=1 Tax=Gonapodya prolifera (strain JEL478) TaxID=1344416 RepID=A0A139AUJ1_GONPJ|nr:hypothetical protein M427DRAFT_66420 [Gonapodya prolifera JEL478]|eukprot:KXS20401.1 hypothetical protein M427DRAFT_66420 [Gonapodya prolifera JEL478]
MSDPEPADRDSTPTEPPSNDPNAEPAAIIGDGVSGLEIEANVVNPTNEDGSGGEAPAEPNENERLDPEDEDAGVNTGAGIDGMMEGELVPEDNEKIGGDSTEDVTSSGQGPTNTFPFSAPISMDTSTSFVPDEYSDGANPDESFDAGADQTSNRPGSATTPPPDHAVSRGPCIPTTDLSGWLNKQYLGGYRHKATGAEYFHASVQTAGLSDNIEPDADSHQDSDTIQMKNGKPTKVSRDTQTKELRNAGAQCRRDATTQMTTAAVFVSSSADRVFWPSQYTTAREWERCRHEAAIKIQCWIRIIFSRRLVAKLRKEKAARELTLEKKEKKRKELLERKKRRELEARLRPRTERDFEKLYNGLEMWHRTETAKIDALNLPHAARLARLACLLDEEASLIQKLDRMRVVATEENSERRIVKMLDKSSILKSPVTVMPSVAMSTVQSSGGATPTGMPKSSAKHHATETGTGGNERIPYVLVDTPHTIRARELRDLYHALCVPLLPVDERLQGISSVEGVTQGVWKFTMTPEFNPAALSFQKVPPRPAPSPLTSYDPTVVTAPYSSSNPRDQAVYYCKGCNLYLPSTKFYLSTTMRYLGKCRSCICRENAANQRRDEGRFAEMLRTARAQEEARANVQAINDTTKREVLGTAGVEAAELSAKARDNVDVSPPSQHVPLGGDVYAPIGYLQEPDMRYLVETIWNGCSAISGVRTPLELVLTRWNPKLPLSPDNCILLTKAEARTHEGALAAQVPVLSKSAMEEAVKGGVLEGLRPEALYSDAFVGKVRRKHVLARQVFKQLPAFTLYVESS